MIAYVDTSVLMRIVLRAPDPLKEWDDLRVGLASILLRVEAFRTLDQLWHWDKLTESERTEKHARLETFLPQFELLPLDEAVLDRAAQPLPTGLATLDAIHLATATLYRASLPPTERSFLFATHDVQLARAARAMDFEVIGA